MGVSNDVGERFLSHSEAGGFDERIEAVLQSVGLEFSLRLYQFSQFILLAVAGFSLIFPPSLRSIPNIPLRYSQ